MLVSMCVVLDSQGLATKPQVGCLPSIPLTKLMGWFGHLVVVFNLGTFATWVYGSSVMSRWIRWELVDFQTFCYWAWVWWNIWWLLSRFVACMHRWVWGGQSIVEFNIGDNQCWALTFNWTIYQTRCTQSNNNCTKNLWLNHNFVLGHMYIEGRKTSFIFLCIPINMQSKHNRHLQFITITYLVSQCLTQSKTLSLLEWGETLCTTPTFED